MTDIKIYMHKYVERPRAKVVFGDDSTCITKGYGSIKCNGTNPSVLVDKTKYAKDELEAAHTKTKSEKEPVMEHMFESDTEDDAQVSFDNEEIKMEDLTKLVQKTEPLVHELIIDFFSTFRMAEGVIDLDAMGTLEFHLGRMSTITSKITKLKVLVAIPDIMNRVSISLDRFADVISSVSQKAKKSSVPFSSQDESRRAYRWFYNAVSFVVSGEYSQWSERFMNYLEEQTDGEAMINSIKNDDQPLPTVTQVSDLGYIKSAGSKFILVLTNEKPTFV
nr:retrovirus-related Pol polyprotein from transposon TNT 1-94 [Tanacetum cinerariifolium]